MLRLSTVVTRSQGVVYRRHSPAPCSLGSLGVRARQLFRYPFTTRSEPRTYLIPMQCDNHSDAIAARARARIASGNFHDFTVTAAASCSSCAAPQAPLQDAGAAYGSDPFLTSRFMAEYDDARGASSPQVCSWLLCRPPRLSSRTARSAVGVIRVFGDRCAGAVG